MQRNATALVVLVCLAGAATPAQTPTPSPTPVPDIGDEWQMTTTFLGNDLHRRMNLKIENGKVTGWIFSDGKRQPFSGTSNAAGVKFETKDGETKAVYTGRFDGKDIVGTVVETDPEDWGEQPPVSFRARKSISAKNRPPKARTLDFEPTEFHRGFSASAAPVLRIWPGDIVRTRTVDAAGVDEKGKVRVLGGNPQTGPFYIEGAMPGDVLAVHIRKLSLNRSTAISDDGLVARAMTNDYAAGFKDNDFKNVVWTLDREKGLARPARALEHLKDLGVPVRPMLGCVGVAPGFGSFPIRTGDSGRIGGNMDYNEVREGATVYLTVSQPGALLYVGDGHALQGDGELNGNALETSLDVELSVDLLREKQIAGPRIENADYLMAMGLAGSLDEAFREAGSGLAQWVQQDYKLTAKETAILLGAVIEYQISEVADRNVGVVARLKKRYLPGGGGVGATR